MCNKISATTIDTLQLHSSALYDFAVIKRINNSILQVLKLFNCQILAGTLNSGMKINLSENTILFQLLPYGF
jgi:thiamine monophosphate kinase